MSNSISCTDDRVAPFDRNLQCMKVRKCKDVDTKEGEDVEVEEGEWVMVVKGKGEEGMEDEKITMRCHTFVTGDDGLWQERKFN